MSAGRRPERPLKAFVINIDRSADRLTHMRQEFDRIGVSFERIPGVDGTTLAAELVEDYRRNGLAANPDGWRPAEIGCFLGHMDAWRRIAGGTDAWAAVFEDDVHAAQDLSALLASTDWIPVGADVVRLEGNRSMRLTGGRAIEPASGRKLYRARSGAPGSAAYIVSRSAAASLLAAPPELRFPTDVFLFKPRISPVAQSLRRYQVVPAVCIQDEVLVRGGNARLKSQIKNRNTRGRGYRERSNPLLRLWPICRHAVPFRP